MSPAGRSLVSVLPDHLPHFDPTGLHCLHVNRLLHRDLTPENLVFSAEGGLRIIDFGMARQAAAPIDAPKEAGVGAFSSRTAGQDGDGDALG